VKIRTQAAFPFGLFILAACAAMVLAGGLLAQPNAPAQAAATQAAPKVNPSAIQVEVMDPGDLRIPPDFRIAEYEYLVEQIAKTKRFKHVYRSGDKNAEGVADLIILHTTAEAFKKGSEKAREVTTVGGWTSIKIKLQFLDRSGKLLLEQDAQGKVRFFGGNLQATYDLAKNIATIVNQTTF
jgi:hypothetical protein